MRIFYAADTTPDVSYQSNIWRENLYKSLVDLGHDVIEFDYDLKETFRNLDPAQPRKRYFIEKNRPKLETVLLSQIKDAHIQEPIDLFFSYFYSACATPSLIEEIKSNGILTVNWFCNGAHQFHLIKELAPAYDWCLVPERFRLNDYRRIGANPIYCQEAANPKFYKPYDLPLEFDVTFVGQAYGERQEYIKHLLDCGIQVRVWGRGWKKYSQSEGPAGFIPYLFKTASHSKKLLSRWGLKEIGRKFRNLLIHSSYADRGSSSEGIVFPISVCGDILSDKELIKLYSRSKINLGFSTCGNTHKDGKPIKQVRLRDFEVPMSGGFYMVEYLEELESFYEIGKEIVCYDDKEDLAEKIRYYLEHEKERENIRKAGYIRCRRDHTWQKRFTQAFKEMGLNTNGDIGRDNI